MKSVLKINCRHVYDSGEGYIKNSDEIATIQKNLDTISNDIYKIWKGPDGNNFLVSFNKHIKSLDAVINFLNGNADILKTTALNHSNIDTKMARDIERSDIDDKHFVA